jgi:hypothetical protein
MFGRRRVAALSVALSWLPILALTVGQRTVLHAAAATMSAIGNEAAITFAVSPEYMSTHFVAALAVPVGGCRSNCTHLWVTRDGGATWHHTHDFAGGAHLAIVEVDPPLESLVAADGDRMVASTDGGFTWKALGNAGNPTETSAFGRDALLVANAGGSDYMVSGRVLHAIPGSEGAAEDLAFAVPLSFDRNSPFAPLLLAADDPRSGTPLILQCDRSLRCGHAVQLIDGEASTSGDVSLLLAQDYARSGIVFARTTRGLYRSSDGGRSFLPVPLPRQTGAVYTTIPAATLNAAGAQQLYAAVLSVVGSGRSQLTAGGVYTSADGGFTWHAVGRPGPLDGGATAVVSAPDGRLFAGYVDAHGAAGLVCSEAGRPWQATCRAETSRCAVPPCQRSTESDVQGVGGTSGSGSGGAADGVGDDAQAQGWSPNGASFAATGWPSVATSRAALLVLLGMLLAAGGCVGAAVLSTRRRRRRPT